MYKLTVKGSAESNVSRKYLLDGWDTGCNMFEFSKPDVSEKYNITGGDTYIVYDGGQIYTVTKYLSPVWLTHLELNELKEWTVGQWSDGIGEGYEQKPQYIFGEDEIYISMWHKHQVAFIYQRNEHAKDF